MYRPVVIGILFLLFFSFAFSFVYADQNEEALETLQKLSEALYHQVKIKEYDKAKSMIEDISVILPSISYEGLTTVEGIEAISSVLIQTKRSLASLEPQYKTTLYYAMQLRLAIDALGHPKQPLWHRYYSAINQDLDEIKRSIKGGEKEWEQALQTFQYHYMLMKPALLVSKPAYSIEKIDSLITALVNQTIEQNQEVLLIQLKETFHQLFYDSEQETWGVVVKEKTLWRTAIGMGLTIFAVLSYVLWRKVRAAYGTTSIGPPSKE